MLLAILLGLGFTIATGCETTEGFGEDVEEAGEEIQEAEEDVD